MDRFENSYDKKRVAPALKRVAERLLKEAVKLNHGQMPTMLYRKYVKGIPSHRKGTGKAEEGIKPKKEYRNLVWGKESKRKKD